MQYHAQAIHRRDGFLGLGTVVRVGLLRVSQPQYMDNLMNRLSQSHCNTKITLYLNGISGDPLINEVYTKSDTADKYRNGISEIRYAADVKGPVVPIAAIIIARAFQCPTQQRLKTLHFLA